MKKQEIYLKKNCWLYIGSVYPKHWESSYGAQYSPTYVVQRSLLKAMYDIGWQMDAILTTPPVRSFPLEPLRRYPAFKNEIFEGHPGASVVSLGWTNCEPVKSLSIGYDLFSFVFRWSKEVRKEGGIPKIFIYNFGPNSHQAVILTIALKILKIVGYVFIADLYPPKNSKNLFQSLQYTTKLMLLRVAGGIAALNNNVLKDFGSKKPCVHLAGVIPDEVYFQKLLVLPISKGNSKFQTLLYTGSLNRRRGIVRLLESFKLIKSKSTRLVITGRGDEEKRVLDAVAGDGRIKYLSLLDSQEARLHVIRNSDILLNPHDTSVSDVRYIFPSKLGEYLASGRIVVSTPMLSMEKFPLEHMVISESESIENFSRAIEDAMAITRPKRIKMALSAREWAEKNLQWDKIAQRLKDFSDD